MLHIEPTAPSVKLDLAELAASITRQHQSIVATDTAKLDMALSAGDKLILVEDSKLVPHGTWATFVKGCGGMSERTARRYMQLARFRGAIEEANRSRATVLSIASALRLISKKTAKAGSEKKGRKPTTTKPASKLSTLDWEDASVEERRRFLNGIRPDSVAEAAPPEWQHQADQDQLFGLLVPPKAEQKIIDLFKKALTGPEHSASNALKSMLKNLRELMAKAHFEPDELVGLRFARAEMVAAPSEEIANSPKPVMSEATPARDLKLLPEILAAASADALVTKH
jgi:hypothetical protein